MEATAFLAKAWGALFALAASAYLIRPKGLKDLMDQTNTNRGFVISTGFTSLVMGVLSVLVHNIWVSDWPLIITLIGWIAILKGFVRLAWPETLSLLLKRVRTTRLLLMLVMALIAGLALYYWGYTLDLNIQDPDLYATP